MSDTNEKRQQLAIERLDEALRKERARCRGDFAAGLERLAPGRAGLTVRLGVRGALYFGRQGGAWA